MSDPVPETIHYRFGLADGSHREFTVRLGGDLVGEGRSDPVSPAEWTALDFNQCPHCPLSPDDHPRCPAAERLAELAEAFSGLMSYETVSVEVTTPERTIVFEQTPIQKALGSLLGLVLPTSGCPHTAFFGPMARFHVPLATRDETIYRAVSMYLLGQWMRRRKGLPADLDLDGLSELYERVQVVNRHLHKRLRGVYPTDSSQNAVVTLDALALLLPMAVDASLDEFEDLFQPYLETGPGGSGAGPRPGSSTPD